MDILITDNLGIYLNSVYNQFSVKTITPYFTYLEDEEKSPLSSCYNKGTCPKIRQPHSFRCTEYPYMTREKGIENHLVYYAYGNSDPKKSGHCQSILLDLANDLIAAMPLEGYFTNGKIDSSGKVYRECV